MSNPTLLQSGIGTLHRPDESRRVIRAIEMECDRLLPGDRLPTPTALMRQLGASERTVVNALRQLTHQGRIVRLRGSGSYTAKPTASDSPGALPMNSTEIVIVSSHDGGYYSAAIELAVRLCDEMAIRTSFEAPQDDHLRGLPDNDDRGYVFIGSNNFELASKLHRNGQRVVVVGDPGFRNMSAVPCVHVDNVMGGYMAGRHLIDCGCQRIAYLPPTEDPKGYSRYWGFKQAARHAQSDGRNVESSVIPPSLFEAWTKSPALALEYVAETNGFVGLFAWNDTDCIQLLTFLQSLGIRVPDHVALVGFDNLPAGSTVTPALTTIEPKLEQQVRLAIDCVIRAPGTAPDHTAILTPELVIRASTRNRNLKAPA